RLWKQTEKNEMKLPLFSVNRGETVLDTADNTNYVKYYRYFCVEIKVSFYLRSDYSTSFIKRNFFFYAYSSRYSPIPKN
ncbi:hypothetical protein, partial [Hungatella hathewayi]|uniref:hypothetical protein n=1 Tax=Hungatella hathewayi TaxID=154046 RepID=UPI0026727B3B